MNECEMKSCVDDSTRERRDYSTVFVFFLFVFRFVVRRAFFVFRYLVMFFWFWFALVVAQSIGASFFVFFVFNFPPLPSLETKKIEGK